MTFYLDGEQTAVDSVEALQVLMLANAREVETFELHDETKDLVLDATGIVEDKRERVFTIFWYNERNDQMFAGDLKNKRAPSIEWVIECFVLFYQQDEGWRELVLEDDIKPKFMDYFWLLVMIAAAAAFFELVSLLIKFCTGKI